MYHGTADTGPHQMPGTRFEERRVISPVAGAGARRRASRHARADWSDGSRTKSRRHDLWARSWRFPRRRWSAPDAHDVKPARREHAEQLHGVRSRP